MATDGSTWAPLRIGAFRGLFIAALTSNIGTWMQTVGAQWFLVEGKASPTVVALVQTARLTPTLLLTVLPQSMRARALAMYLVILIGSQALGSLVWGVVASKFGLVTSLTASAVLLVVAAASVGCCRYCPSRSTIISVGMMSPKVM
jgi:uncharacterized membrane protein